MTTTTAPGRPVGELLRGWRERRRLSQLELSSRVDVSTRHLSYIENGKARPSPDMILRLTEHLQIPLRERNEVLLAGGYAPAYPQRGLDAPALARVSDALRLVLDRHLPYPALVLNRWWEMVDTNDAITPLLQGVSPALLEPPVNVLRLTLHPDGLAPRIVNLGQWRAHLLSQLARRIEATGDEQLRSLQSELIGYPGGAVGAAPSPHDVVLPLVLRVGHVELSMFTIAASVGTAADVTVEELVVESFYPADDATAAFLRAGKGILMRFVFVHGAFVRDGAWWWAPVAARLDAVGPSVAVRLPSCGEAGVAPTGVGPDLFDDAAALRALLDDGEPSVVVAHSYGAMVAAQATAGVTSVRHLVAVSAFPAFVGEALGALGATTDNPVPVAVDESGAAYLDMADITARFLHDVTSPELVQGAHDRLTRQSSAVFGQALTASGWTDHPTTAVVCSEDRSTPPWLQREYAGRADRVVELAASHHPMLSMPAEFASLLTAVAVAG